jgi:hypothetical protein
MKKCCFVKFLRRNFANGFQYEVVSDVMPGDAFCELPGSLVQYSKIDFQKFSDLDSETNLFIAFDHVDVTDLFKTEIKKFVDSVNCKAIWYDFSTYDNQEIGEDTLDIFEAFSDKQCYFITKNLIKNRNNQFYFEVLFYHHIRPTCEIPRHLASYRGIKDSQTIFWPKYKAFYYPGHTRFHKVKLLEYLHQNNFLDEIIWSCTSPDFDKPVFNDFVPLESHDEFYSFDVLKLLPKRIDFDLFSKDTYNSRGGQVNLVTYLDTYFEIVPETRFYDTTNEAGGKQTYRTWNNISEKTMKPTLLGHPFILLAKHNTIKLLEEYGLKYRFDFWDFKYDSIEEPEERMNAVKDFITKVMKMENKELKQFNNDYYHYTKENCNKLINDVYVKSVNDISNKL